jgi:hypothetical protein
MAQSWPWPGFWRRLVFPATQLLQLCNHPPARAAWRSRAAAVGACAQRRLPGSLVVAAAARVRLRAASCPGTAAAAAVWHAELGRRRRGPSCRGAVLMRNCRGRGGTVRPAGCSCMPPRPRCRGRSVGGSVWSGGRLAGFAWALLVAVRCLFDRVAALRASAVVCRAATTRKGVRRAGGAACSAEPDALRVRVRRGSSVLPPARHRELRWAVMRDGAVWRGGGSGPHALAGVHEVAAQLALCEGQAGAEPCEWSRVPLQPIKPAADSATAARGGTTRSPRHSICARSVSRNCAPRNAATPQRRVPIRRTRTVLRAQVRIRLTLQQEVPLVALWKQTARNA